MNRLNKTLLFSAILVMLAASPAISQKKYDKKLQKADDKYEYGDYKKANKFLAKFKTTVEKKLGTSNKYIPIYYLREAMYSWASGIVVGFDASIEQAVQSSATFHGESSTDHALIQMQAAEIYLLYGNYHKADSLIENFAVQWLEFDDVLEAEPDLTVFPNYDDALVEAMRLIPASKVSLIITCNPLLTILMMDLMAVYGLDFITPEPLEWRGYLGALLVVAGVVTAVSLKSKARS